MKCFPRILKIVILTSSLGFFLMIARKKKLHHSKLDSNIQITNLEFERNNLRNGWEVMIQCKYLTVSWSSFPEFYLSTGKMEEEVEFTLPKTLHFIWIGDSIIKKYMRNILLFAERNPSYKAKLINNNKSKMSMSLAAKYVFRSIYGFKIRSVQLTKFLIQFLYKK